MLKYKKCAISSVWNCSCWHHHTLSSHLPCEGGSNLIKCTTSTLLDWHLEPAEILRLTLKDCLQTFGTRCRTHRCYICLSDMFSSSWPFLFFLIFLRIQTDLTGKEHIWKNSTAAAGQPSVTRFPIVLVFFLLPYHPHLHRWISVEFKWQRSILKWFNPLWLTVFLYVTMCLILPFCTSACDQLRLGTQFHSFPCVSSSLI